MKKTLASILALAVLTVPLSVARAGDSGAAGTPLVQGTDSKAVEAAIEKPASDNKTWILHAQATEIVQGQPGFNSPYVGPQSLTPGDNLRQTSTVDLFLGAHIWPGGALYFNPEYYQGYGFAGTFGIAAFPNGEAYKMGKHNGDAFIPHLVYQQVIGLGGEQEDIPEGQLQLPEKVDISRLTFTVGKMAVTDQFDANTYSHDPTTQFMNWALIDSGAFDYAADSLGYVEGATAELNQKTWALRYGIFDVPAHVNGLAIDGHYLKAWQQVLELEERYSIGGHPGKTRLLGWLESAHMGNYAETLANPSYDDDINLDARYRYQYGFVLNCEQEIATNVGDFLRASWRDGQSEDWQFTDIDQGLAAGLSFSGALWKRESDTFGIAGMIDGLSPQHRAYLAAGGSGITVGDGQLPHYALEDGMEMYYDFQVVKDVRVAFDYQLIANPAYNADRGPINIFSARLHLEF
jgi:high affinity Mn2+ porin